MKKLVYTITLLVLSVFVLQTPCEARKYVLNITPAQEINTKDESLQKGSVVKFTSVNDVYVDGHLYIQKDTPVTALVNYVERDAWIGETPLLILSYFETKDVTGDPVVIDYTLKIKAKYGMSKFIDYAKYYTKSIIFCANLDLKPNDLVFNVLFEKEEGE